jgi:L-cysteine S-thiosulfotransferase
MRRLLSISAFVALAFAVTGLVRMSALQAQSGAGVAAEIVDKAIKASWTGAAADWQKRLDQDDLQTVCTAAKNNPSPAVAEGIAKAAKAAMLYPADGKLLGDWKKGEVLAQSGYGMRFTDTDTSRPNGGNCYACHQLTKTELSYGTLGPSLEAYGKIRKFTEADTKAAYEKIFNSHAALPCSQMPRFGVAGVLTTEQITHLVALLMDPASPVNQ